MKFGIEEVVATGSCVGCGGCGQISFPRQGKIPLVLSPLGTKVPDLSSFSKSQKGFASQVCPISDLSLDEDEIALRRGLESAQHDPVIGYFSKIYFGRSASDDLTRASSGGMLGSILDGLISSGVVDDAIQVGRDANGDINYGLRSSLETVSVGSIYEPVGLESGRLTEIVKPGRKYAFVGLPCALRSISNLIEITPELKDSFPILAGLVCGHLKSRFYGDALLRELRLNPSVRGRIRYRIKEALGVPGNYSMGLEDKSGGPVPGEALKVGDYFAGNWGLAMFQLNGCNYCDDLLAECADFSVGDAWLPEFATESRGTSLVVSRNVLVDHVISQLSGSGKVWVREGDLNEARATQSGNIRYRRDGLKVRLLDDAAKGAEVPTKRKFDVGKISPLRRAIYRSRREIARVSNDEYQRVDNATAHGRFRRRIASIVARHHLLVWLNSSLTTKLKLLVASLVRM